MKNVNWSAVLLAIIAICAVATPAIYFPYPDNWGFLVILILLLFSGDKKKLVLLITLAGCIAALHTLITFLWAL